MEKNNFFADELMSIIPADGKMSAIEWLAEQMPGGFFTYRADESTELLYVNRSVCDIFGCDDVGQFRELVGNSFRGMVHPDDYDKIQSSIDDQIARSDNDHNMDYVVYRIIRKDGQIRWVDDYGHFAHLPGYGDVYCVFIGDITETRLAAEEKARTEELQLALEAAEQANLAKSAFLSNMSHEIRTPITAILGMNEMIRQETEDETVLAYAENISKAGASLLGIISDILDFSKIETGKLELDCDEYALKSLVGDLYNLVCFRAEDKGLQLFVSVDPALPSRLVGDVLRVKQIITNMLTNAAKYTEKGSVTFQMSLEEKSDGAVRIAVSVTDTGIGIRAEEMDKLFEPFDRLDVKKTKNIEGTGLGLAITRQLLHMMDSELKVKSEYGKGSTFYFSLVQKIADDTPVGTLDMDKLQTESARSLRRQALFTAPDMKILVVDDTPMNLQVIAGLLKRTKMQIDMAQSGMECIEKFGQNTYDLVFLDYRMPMMNGIETLNELRERYPEAYRRTPIISLTASAIAGDREKMIGAGFTDYLSKPVDIGEMERMMLKYLPQDAVIVTEEEPEAEDDELTKLPEIIFHCAALDVEKGLNYCGDADDYMYAIETFADSVFAKAKQLEENLADGDAEAFTINVHSLKSTSGAIGAVAFSEKARALEEAGKNEDWDVIRRDTPALLGEYREMKGMLQEILDAYDEMGA